MRTRAPITLDAESEPEPDIAVVPGGPRDYLAAHPSCPPLVLEVAEATLPLDRNHKSSLYARAQIPDYWLVNLPTCYRKNEVSGLPSSFGRIEKGPR